MKVQLHLFHCRDFILSTVLLLSAAALLFWPEQAADAMRSGMTLCVNVLLPSLFPFFVLSSLVIELGMSRYMGQLLSPVMKPLFQINGQCSSALVLGLLGGYPVGARTAIQLYESGQCSKTEAERLLAFCNNCGPAFILGVVGTGLFGSSSLGLLLYLIHILACLMTGIIFRFYRGDSCMTQAAPPQPIRAVRLSSALIHCVTGAMTSMLHICSFVLFFSVIIGLLDCSGIFSALSGVLALLFTPIGMDRVTASRLLMGILEVSSGITSLTGGPLPERLSLAAFMLGWAGLSVHCQVMSFLDNSGLSLRVYLAGKLIHATLSAGMVALLTRFYPLSQTVSLYLAEQTETIAHLDFQQVLTISVAAAWLAWIIFFLSVIHISKKRSGKSLGHAL